MSDPQTTDLIDILNSYRRPTGPNYHREYQEYLRSHGWEIISEDEGRLHGLWKGPPESHPMYAPPPCPGLTDPWPHPGVLVRVAEREQTTKGWQPIETAPKAPFDKYGQEEGPMILLCGGFLSGGQPSVRTGHWKGKRTNAWADTALGRCPRIPTHWMPLPEPPK